MWGIYIIILLFFLILFFLTRHYKRAYFCSLDKKEHPFRILYSMAARIYDFIGNVISKEQKHHITGLLKSLLVKENVETEKYLYYVKKTAISIAVFTGIVLLGFLTEITKEGVNYVTSVSRAEHGQGNSSYEFEVEYKNSENVIDLDIAQVQYTESEILELFEQAYEGVKKEVLGNNSSADQVEEALNLISEYGEIHISWEIEDLSTVDYNGEIKADLEEGESLLVTLGAVFSLDDVTQTYMIPLNLTGKTLTQREQLFNSIRDAIQENNDAFSREVQLPEEIDGYKIRFKTIPEEKNIVFLFLSIASVIAIFLFYDKKLENEVKKRQARMMLDFTEIVSKLNLLYEAGLSIHGAFERIVEDHERQEREKNKSRKGKKKEERPAYREMKFTLEKIKSGVSESEAYSQFGKRCALYPYIKLGNLLEQNLNKGTKGMKDLLKQTVEEAFQERKRLARKRGEEASTKLLVPMVMMLMIVIAIIAIPALMAMNI